MKDSKLFFAVPKMLGNKLRSTMLRLEDAASSTIDYSGVGDCDILGSVLRNMKERVLDPEKRVGPLCEALYKLFTPNLESIEGIHGRYLTLNKEIGKEKSDYIHWAVDEAFQGACPFTTYYGIPVYLRIHRRKTQDRT